MATKKTKKKITENKDLTEMQKSERVWTILNVLISDRSRYPRRDSE